MAKLDEHKADRVRIVDHVTRAYAHQIFVDGFYSADPHPGNILVDRTTLMPVLLDFGLTKELDAHTRYNFARLLVAVAEQDMHGLLDALEGVGLKLRPDVPFDAALLARYFFRDAKTQAVARAESQQRRADLRRRVAEAARHVYAGDRVDVKLRGFLGTKSRKGEVLWVGDGHVRVKLTNGEEKEVPRDAVRLQAGRSPIDAWPDSFIFFDRVLGLLRGLTAALNVTQSYLDVMVPYARRALESHDAPGADEQKTIKAAPSAPIVGAPGEHLPAAHAQVSAAVSTPAADAAMPLSAVAVALPGFGVGGVDRLGGISELVQELIDSEDVLGCQVCVLRNGEPIVDLWGGRLSPYDRRPVARDSLFNCFSVRLQTCESSCEVLFAFSVHTNHSVLQINNAGAGDQGRSHCRGTLVGPARAHRSLCAGGEILAGVRGRGQGQDHCGAGSSPLQQLASGELSSESATQNHCPVRLACLLNSIALYCLLDDLFRSVVCLGPYVGD
mmetsp:Transcript_39787/g.106092  ORF Transcript_39787/g.106092 Transcript_39787/m.106092 type:complete len:500 (+) Transcript_39787:1107-2606(+)